RGHSFASLLHLPVAALLATVARVWCAATLLPFVPDRIRTGGPRGRFHLPPYRTPGVSRGVRSGPRSFLTRWAPRRPTTRWKPALPGPPAHRHELQESPEVVPPLVPPRVVRRR